MYTSAFIWPDIYIPPRRERPSMMCIFISPVEPACFNTCTSLDEDDDSKHSDVFPHKRSQAYLGRITPLENTQQNMIGTCYPMKGRGHAWDVLPHKNIRTKKNWNRLPHNNSWPWLGRITPWKVRIKLWLRHVTPWEIVEMIGTYITPWENTHQNMIGTCYPMKGHEHAWDVLPPGKIRDKIWLGRVTPWRIVR